MFEAKLLNAINVFQIYDIIVFGKSKIEIKKQYLVKLKLYHPDHGGSLEITQKLNAAWDLIKTNDFFPEPPKPISVKQEVISEQGIPQPRFTGKYEIFNTGFGYCYIPVYQYDHIATKDEEKPQKSKLPFNW